MGMCRSRLARAGALACLAALAGCAGGAGGEGAESRAHGGRAGEVREADTTVWPRFTKASLARVPEVENKPLHVGGPLVGQLLGEWTSALNTECQRVEIAQGQDGITSTALFCKVNEGWVQLRDLARWSELRMRR